MNNYHYIAICKASSWKNDPDMQAACVVEFHNINPADTIDTKALAIAAAKRNGINPAIIAMFCPPSDIRAHLTSGHLVNNGGIRGHSAGSIYPWRIMAQGTFKNLLWWVINPRGEKTTHHHTTYAAMNSAKRQIKALIS